MRPKVEGGNHGKIVAINLETGDFEVDGSEITACDHLEARHSDAQIWIVPIGSRYVRRFGGPTKRTYLNPTYAISDRTALRPLAAETFINYILSTTQNLGCRS